MGPFNSKSDPLLPELCVVEPDADVNTIKLHQGDWVVTDGGNLKYTEAIGCVRKLTSELRLSENEDGLLEFSLEFKGQRSSSEETRIIDFVVDSGQIVLLCIDGLRLEQAQIYRLIDEANRTNKDAAILLVACGANEPVVLICVSPPYGDNAYPLTVVGKNGSIKVDIRFDGNE